MQHSFVDFAGISDSLLSFSAPPKECPYCGAAARLGGDQCLSCLLRAGAEDEKSDDTQSLEELLGEIDLRDSDWRLGNYQILEEIGRGGMGVIYRARQRHSKRIVALKRVLSYHGDSRETLERFRREAQAAASLDHPNILPIYEVGEAEGLPFFTMKYATGGSLQQAAPALMGNTRECVRLLAKVTRAIAYAHREGILHRDLKPGNILLDCRGEPMVTDFGLAKWIDADCSLTRSLAIFGTPGFIAPEQANGPRNALTPAADVYSLGAILFGLLAGRPPHLGENALAIIQQAAEKPAPKLRTLNQSLGKDLETICAKCLEREPQARYHSASALAEDLERWLEGRPILARPVSLPMRGWRWARREPVLSSSFAAVFVALVLAAAYQARGRQLQAQLHLGAEAEHSVVVLPFLDLDEGNPDQTASKETTDVLRLAMQRIGAAKVTYLTQAQTRWTGTGNETEARLAAKTTRSRTVLAGTKRNAGDKVRLSLHLLNGDAHEILQNWLLELAPGESISRRLPDTDIARQTYGLLDQAKIAHVEMAPDPVMENSAARPFMLAGEQLLYRRNIPDMDRAIGCFEGAIKAEPRSITARCYLAFALMGRDLLASTPELAARARQVAYEAVGLAPNDPTAHRAVCAIATSLGDYPEALEHAYRALESGDQSERAFGEIGYVWKMTGRPDRALRWLEKVRVTHQRPAECDHLVGDCWLELGQIEKAKQYYESAVAFQPDQPDGWMGLCRIKLLAGDYNGAREIYQREQSKYDGSVSGQRMAALVEFFAGNLVEAERRYRDLVKEDPLGGVKGGFYGAVDYRSALGCLALLADRKEEAQGLLTACLEAEQERVASIPTDPLAYYRKSAVQAMLAQNEAALADLEAAFKAGWIDYRSTKADPRFRNIAGTERFNTLLEDASKRLTRMAKMITSGTPNN